MLLFALPAAIMGASPGMTGTARAQSQLRQAFVFPNTYAMTQPEVLVSRAHDKFDQAGTLIDQATRRFLATFLRGVLGMPGALRHTLIPDALDGERQGEE